MHAHRRLWCYDRRYGLFTKLNRSLEDLAGRLLSVSRPILNASHWADLILVPEISA